MPELPQSEASNLGVGIALDSRFDVEARNGSIDTADGFEVLARDLSFSLTRVLDDELGGLPTPERNEETAIETRRLVARDDRADLVPGSVDVETDPTRPSIVEIDLSVEAQTGERGELVLRPNT
jgi:hypothetical protein